MFRTLCLALLLAGSLSPARADHARVLVDGQRLGSLPAEAGFLLPDGTLLLYQALYEACRDHQAAGNLYFRPATGECRPLIEVFPPELPERIELGDGIVVFNQLTRETCRPGNCQVVMAGTSIPGSGTGEPPPEPDVVIDGFAATPDSLVGSGTTTLSWASSNADSCTLADDQGSPVVTVATTGSADRAVSVTTQFTLTCSNAVSSDSAFVSVTVTPLAVIDGFSAEPASLVGSGTVTLSWNSTDADSCMISDDQGSTPESVVVDGSVDRLVGVTTEFGLACSNAVSTDTATATVTVTPPAVIDSFSADPASLVGAGTVTLSWASTDADSCVLEDDQGGLPETVGTAGSVERQVEATTLYTLTCENPVSSDAASLTVTVSEEPLAPVDPIFVDRFEALIPQM